MDFVVRYPDRLDLVQVASKIAQQEIAHFRQVFRRMRIKGMSLRPDEKSVYIRELGKAIRHESLDRLLDRVLCSVVIELRGQERFGLIAENHPEHFWAAFYRDLWESEKDHYLSYWREACKLFPEETVRSRWEEIRALESEILSSCSVNYKLFP